MLRGGALRGTLNVTVVSGLIISEEMIENHFSREL